MLALGCTTAGQAAIADDGSQPGFGDAAGLFVGTGASLLLLIALFNAASGYVKMSRPDSSTVFIEDAISAISEGGEKFEEELTGNGLDI